MRSRPGRTATIPQSSHDQKGGGVDPAVARGRPYVVDVDLEKFFDRVIVHLADDCRVYIASKRAGKRVMTFLRKLYGNPSN